MSPKNRVKRDTSNNVNPRMPRKDKLDNHSDIQSRDPLQCNFCERKCQKPSDLKIHLRIHTGEKPFVCTICQKGFSTAGNLNAHAFRFHGIPIKSRRRARRKGFSLHKNTKRFTCQFCSKEYNRPSKLSVHLKTHTGDKPYLCEVCKCSFRRRDTLKIHMRVHTGEKPYKCSQCNLSFAQSSSLITHNRTKQHLSKLNREKPFKCNICKKCFNKNSNLTVHRRIHTGEKPYECMHCSQRFASSRRRKDHFDNCTGIKKGHGHDSRSDQEFGNPLINAVNDSNQASISKEERASQWGKFIVAFNAKIVSES